PEYSSQEMFESIEASGLFESLIGFSFALVELPQKILFESENSELGLTREYEFADNFSNAIVGLESIKGDKLKVDISATFLGTELADIFAYEAENITATPIWGDTKLDLEVASLEKEILFAATVFASNALTKDSLESELETIADVNSVEINFPSIAPKIFVSSASAWEDSKVHDFNIFLQGIEHQRADIFNDTEFFVEIVFDTDSNLLDAKQAIEAQISAMGAEASVEENSDEILGSLFLLTVDSAKAALALEELLSANAFGEITIKQIGRLGLAELTDANTSTAYAVPNNEIDATLNTGHLIGDSVSAEITYSVVRGEIGYIRAVEETIE
ncbi:MAG: hypothetical protein JW772_02160, partial [Candidatus Diapherotrites archaeon]|nr:hypothetical protein [Candidatus Diapherotrites archaeon]